MVGLEHERGGFAWSWGWIVSSLVSDQATRDIQESAICHRALVPTGLSAPRGLRGLDSQGCRDDKPYRPQSERRDERMLYDLGSLLVWLC